MAAQIRVSDLNALLEAGKQLNDLLKESPAITAFAEALQQSKEPILVVEQDRLVLAGEAAKILGTNKSQIGQYVKQGLLTPYYIAGSRLRRFQLSEIWKIPKREAKNDDKHLSA